MKNKGDRTDRITVITPAFNEEKNISSLYHGVRSILSREDIDYELIIIDDHSEDFTFAEICKLSENDARVHGFRLSRNSGSHKAILCGLGRASGDCAVVMAADLQDDPELILKLYEEWKKGAQVVWAVRNAERGKTSIGRSSRIYYWMMRRVFGASEMPETGADFFLLDRRVIDTLKKYPESNSSVIGLIMWMGFRQSHVYYEKQPRKAGRSGWTLSKKIKLLLDSITSFSYMPIRVMSAAGFIVAGMGFLYSMVVVVNAILGKPIQGWSSLMMVILIVGGLQILMLGVLGEYLWRALDESRRRPLYMIEADTDSINFPEKDR